MNPGLVTRRITSKQAPQKLLHSQDCQSAGAGNNVSNDGGLVLVVVMIVAVTIIHRGQNIAPLP